LLYSSASAQLIAIIQIFVCIRLTRFDQSGDFKFPRRNITLFMIQAVIFDLDGTLVDSNELHVASWDRSFRHFGKRFSLEALRRQIGKGSDQYLPEFLNEEEMKRFGEELDEYRSELFTKEYLARVKPFPKVRELFERIKGNGKRIALATSSKKSESKIYKKLLRIEDLVDAETNADDAEKSKPCPDIFVVALQKLNDPPDNVIVVGDTPYDVEAAKKIGLKTIGLLCGGASERTLRETGAIAIYRDPADLLERYADSPIAR
jgi:HAD superfamily hydrolase (TIGR01549 family)